MAFDSLKKIFKKEESQASVQAPLQAEPPKPVTPEATDMGNIKVKMDLLLTQLESLNVRYETLNQRMANLERMVQEIYAIAKRS
jgi:hypothetical protein